MNMKLVKRIIPLLSIFDIDTGGKETAVEIVPSVPEWAPVGDIIPHPNGQQVKSITKRIEQYDNVTIFEHKTIYLPNVEAVPTPQPAGPYEFETYRSNQPPEPWEYQVLADWHAGRATWRGGQGHPDQLGRQTAQQSGGIVLNGGGTR